MIVLRVRELRLAKGWTQAEVAKRARVREATVSRLETNKVTAIDLGVLERVARALDVPAPLLLAEVEKWKPPRTRPGRPRRRKD
ncbi:MAG: helix-turn-helix transcriptional regulator [Gemmatimonadetes bacterium]|nr:helix-turn-helix transcriptional regulator [Gemmatimonadota bacterium]